MAKTHVVHVHKRKDGSTATMKEDQRLASLAPNERRAVEEAFGALAIKERELRVMRAGYNSVWMELRERYKLPAEFSYDFKEGIVRLKGTASNGGGASSMKEK